MSLDVSSVKAQFRAAERTRTSISLSGYSHTWDPNRIFVAKVLVNRVTELIVTSSILVSIVLVVVETDTRASDGELSTPWMVIDYLLMTIYVVELIARLYVHRMSFFHSKMNCMDFVIVAMDLVMEILSHFQFLVPIPSIRFLRILRFLRIFRALGVLTHFRELYMMVHGLVSALKAVGWACVLLTGSLLLWAILCVEVLHPLNQNLSDGGHYQDCERCPRYYSSVWDAMLTIFQQTIAGDSWGIVNIDLIEAYPTTSLLFFAIVISINLGLVNLVLMVIVDRAEEAREADVERKLQEERKAAEEAKNYVHQLCKNMDTDNDGTVTLEEVSNAYDESPEFAHLLDFMGAARDDLEGLFAVLDESQAGQVLHEDFVEQLYKMKTEDTHMMLVFIRYYVITIRNTINDEMQILKDFVCDQGREDKLVERIVTAVQRGCTFPSEHSVAKNPGLLVTAQNADAEKPTDAAIRERSGHKSLSDEAQRLLDESTSRHLVADKQVEVLASLENASRQMQKIYGEVVDEEIALHAKTMLTRTEALAFALDQEAHAFLDFGRTLHKLSVAQPLPPHATKNLPESWQISSGMHGSVQRRMQELECRPSVSKVRSSIGCCPADSSSERSHREALQ